MVWFQCEDCGDELKKPKLRNHFRQCSAFKLSCLDCGKIFGQQDVENHTLCITEAEKYGPKGQAKASNGIITKPKNNSNSKPEVDINVGLSNRPPWFCSLCNTETTSKQTLLQHADGKKHRAKARAFHASKQPPTDTAETKSAAENNAKDEISENKDSSESRDQNSSKVAPLRDGSEMEENKALESNKKRKIEASVNGGAQHHGEVIQIKRAETEVEKDMKKAKHIAAREDAKKEIKWKKLITSALKSNENGVMKLKKLRKLVVQSLKESGYTEDKNQVSEMLEQKINSSSRFIADGKYVRLATSSEDLHI